MKRRASTATFICECRHHAFADIGKGHTVLFSEQDAALVGACSWYVGRGYALAKSPKFLKNKRMHRLFLQPAESQEIDHENHDRLDNQRRNIRVATRSQNMHRRRTKCKYGYRGIKPAKNGKFRAGIDFMGKTYSLGTYASAAEAAHAYDCAAVRLQGKFALTNGTVRA